MLTEKEGEMTCEIEGCDKPVRTRGLCTTHYGRWERAQNALRDCSVENCERGAYQKGWCGHHYNRYRKYGDPLAGPPKPRPKYTAKDRCNWPDCDEFAKSLGLCAPHYQTVRYSAKHEHLIPEEARAERCMVPECEEPQYAKGLCRPHYAKQQRGETVFKDMSGSVDYSEFGKRVFMARANAGMSLRDVAKKAGVSAERIRQLEELAAPPAAHVVKWLSEALGLEPAQLVGASAQRLPAGTKQPTSKRRNAVTKSKFTVELDCLWCEGSGNMALSSGRETPCAYCQGYGRIAILPVEKKESRPDEANGHGEGSAVSQPEKLG